MAHAHHGTPRGLRPGSSTLQPEHLYKGIGLLFLFALLFRHFDGLARATLTAYAAAILAVALNAIVRRIPGERRWISASLGLVIVAALVASFWFAVPLLAGQMREFTEQIPAFQEEMDGWSRWFRERTGLEIGLGLDRGAHLLESAVVGDGADLLQRATGALGWLVFPLIVLFGGLYAVGKPNERLLLPLLRAVPRDMREDVTRILSLLGVRLLAWVKGTLAAMFLVGLLSTIAFYVIGVPYPFLLGVFVGLVEFIPLLGPWIGGFAAVFVAFMHDPQTALWTALAVIVIQQLESNVITPLVMSSVADVHPFITLFALVYFGTLFGFMGILLALPMVLLIWTVLEVLWVERAIDTDQDRIDPVVQE
jgi:predicted PurR-regulated permease PerM